MDLYLSNLNVLHHKDCPCCSYKTLIEFKQSTEENDYEFLISTITYLTNLENTVVIEICPHCLGQKFNNISSELNLSKTSLG